MVPVMYDYMNAVNSTVNPSTVHVHGTGLAWFFKRYLMQKAFYPYEWDMPSTWDKDYFRYVLFSFGYIAVFNTDKFGVIPQDCTLKGYNVFYAPTHCIIMNPLINGFHEPKIGTQCVLIKLTPDYRGIMDLVDYYGDLMALCAESIGVNILNTKLAYVFAASNKNQAESMKKLFDKIASGEPAAFVDKSLYREDGSPNWEMFQSNVRNTYVAGDMLSDLRKLEAEFDTKIGIPNANTDKKERLITDEVNANNVETKSLIEQWLESMQKGCREARELFGINLDVRFRKGLLDEINNQSNGNVQLPK